MHNTFIEWVERDKQERERKKPEKKNEKHKQALDFDEETNEQKKKKIAHSVNVELSFVFGRVLCAQNTLRSFIPVK